MRWGDHRRTVPRPLVMRPLAVELHDAAGMLRDAELRIETYLGAIFDRWCGWSFDAATLAIDVFEATDNAVAAAALHRAGFVTVTIHAHNQRRYLTCQCPAREAPL